MDKITNLNFPTPKANMQLRSGKVVHTQPTKQEKKQEPTYEQHSAVVASTLQHYKNVRQRETEEFIKNEFIPALNMMQWEQSHPPNDTDGVIHQIRGVTAVYEYLNTTSEEILMNPMLDSTRSLALEQCETLKKDAKRTINKRIKDYPQYLPNYCETKSAAGAKQYYTYYLNKVLEQLNLFQATYGGR